MTPQPVLSPLTRAAIFLVLTIDEGGEDAVRDLLPDVPALQRAVGFRVPDGGLKCVVGIGADAWTRLFDAPPPPGLHPFRELAGPRHLAPSTPGDLLFHIRAGAPDLCFELATQLTARLAGAATVVDEVHGFKYFEMRDLMGFVDGTENPEDADALAAALTPADDPVHPESSYVIVQKYLHDLDAWNALPVEAQERVIGRTKLADIEIADKAPDSHVAVNTIVDADGEERQIVRDNMPFGTVGTREFGTYFIGYAADPSITELMLERMFVGDPPGRTDRILDFSTAVTGGLFFVPSLDFLDDPPGPPGAPPAAPPPAGTDADSTGDGSLKIGSLKGIPR
ncbi:Dyp-type peroxidase [Nakamurella alba]|uniref:Dyp-type peroxidase n=1 Tax=Nakamurella alba TaxID=2665158 RepID=UPI002AC33DBA|nr:Dyp-type peroxidase [Nakamurella alba]